MPPGSTDLHRQLEEAWQHWNRLDFPAIRELLQPLATSELVAEPELGFLLAYSLYQLGDWERALPIVEVLRDVCERRGNDQIYRRRMNLEGMIRFGRGELRKAEELWTAVLDAAYQAGDARYIADVYNNLGTVSDVRCEHVMALAYFQRALAAHYRNPNIQGIAAAHSNIGMSYRQLGFLSQADFHFGQAISTLSKGGSESFLAGFEMERAILLKEMGDFRMAQAVAGRALRRYRKLGNEGGEGDTIRVLGMIAVAQGRRGDARTLFDQALIYVRRAFDRLAEAETLEEIAVLDLMDGKASATDVAEAACALYRQIGTEPRAMRVHRRLINASQGPTA